MAAAAVCPGSPLLELALLLLLLLPVLVLALVPVLVLVLPLLRTQSRSTLRNASALPATERVVPSAQNTVLTPWNAAPASDSMLVLRKWNGSMCAYMCACVHDLVHDRGVHDIRRPLSSPVTAGQPHLLWVLSAVCCISPLSHFSPLV